MPFSAVESVRIFKGNIDFEDQNGWQTWAKPEDTGYDLKVLDVLIKRILDERAKKKWGR
jgi:hypothetical protein